MPSTPRTSRTQTPLAEKKPRTTPSKMILRPPKRQTMNHRSARRTASASLATHLTNVSPAQSLGFQSDVSPETPSTTSRLAHARRPKPLKVKERKPHNSTSKTPDPESLNCLRTTGAATLRVQRAAAIPAHSYLKTTTADHPHLANPA
ncbi:hypothetical protein BU16DRAFT_370920 [Lophium mytilinum]|uniref:Uncharacterized protein n=1 Tax=Lophium mytilinum TaxID=390894 RepID=A0A6A6QUY6_9PEZI|nr:hypothetical protein BU16DRAFT_370920 [Lophium mytilinum]